MCSVFPAVSLQVIIPSVPPLLIVLMMEAASTSETSADFY
jgi:hypothetical protein